MIINHPPAGKEVYVTDDHKVLNTTPDADLNYFSTCNHAPMRRQIEE